MSLYKFTVDTSPIEMYEWDEDSSTWEKENLSEGESLVLNDDGSITLKEAYSTFFEITTFNRTPDPTDDLSYFYKTSEIYTSLDGTPLASEPTDDTPGSDDDPIGGDDSESIEESTLYKFTVDTSPIEMYEWDEDSSTWEKENLSEGESLVLNDDGSITLKEAYSTFFEITTFNRTPDPTDDLSYFYKTSEIYTSLDGTPLASEPTDDTPGSDDDPIGGDDSESIEESTLYKFTVDTSPIEMYEWDEDSSTWEKENLSEGESLVLNDDGSITLKEAYSTFFEITTFNRTPDPTDDLSYFYKTSEIYTSLDGTPLASEPTDDTPDQDILTGTKVLDSSTGTTKVTGDDGIIDRFTLQTDSAPSTPFRLTAFDPTEDIFEIPQELAGSTVQRTLFVVAKVDVPDRPLTKTEKKLFNKQQKIVSKSVKRIGRTGDGFAYNQLTGELSIDTNGKKKGFGDGGGLLAVFEDTPAIGIDNLQFL